MLTTRARRAVRRVPGFVTLVDTAAHLADTARGRWLRDVAHDMEAGYLEKRWDFDVPLERARHARILQLVRGRRPDLSALTAVEVGCAGGVFTRELAGLCRSVLALDIAATACRQAAAAVADRSNVRVMRLNIVAERPPETFDLVFVMDVLECIPGPDRVRRALDNSLAVLRPGGILAVSVCKLPPVMEGRRWAKLLREGAEGVVGLVNGSPRLRLLCREDHPAGGSAVPTYIDHVLAVWEKTA